MQEPDPRDDGTPSRFRPPNKRSQATPCPSKSRAAMAAGLMNRTSTKLSAPPPITTNGPTRRPRRTGQ